MIVSSALMIWKGLMVVTSSESPIVVVLRYLLLIIIFHCYLWIWFCLVFIVCVNLSACEQFNWQLWTDFDNIFYMQSLSDKKELITAREWSES